MRLILEIWRQMFFNDSFLTKLGYDPMFSGSSGSGSRMSSGSWRPSRISRICTRTSMSRHNFGTDDILLHTTTTREKQLVFHQRNTKYWRWSTRSYTMKALKTDLHQRFHCNCLNPNYLSLKSDFFIWSHISVNFMHWLSARVLASISKDIYASHLW